MRIQRIQFASVRSLPAIRAAYVPLLLLAVGLVYPFVASNPYLVSTGVVFFIQALLVASLAFLMGWAGQISLGHASLYAIGAYTSAILTARAGVPFPLAFFVAGALAGLAAFVVGLPSLRLSGHYLAMATLGFAEIVVVILIEADALTGGTNGLVGIPAAAFGSYVLDNAYAYYYFAFAVFLAILYALYLLTHTRLGRAMLALHANEVAATSLGLNVAALKLGAFVISGIVAGLAGSLYTHLNRFVSPETFSLSYSIILVAMVVIGGSRSLGGAVAAAFLLTFSNEYLRAYQDFNYLIFGLLLVIIVLFFKAGLAGAYTRLRAFVSRTARGSA
jgi:branched-chain amino acid transport system permease protein